MSFKPFLKESLCNWLANKLKHVIDITVYLLVVHTIECILSLVLSISLHYAIVLSINCILLLVFAKFIEDPVLSEPSFIEFILKQGRACLWLGDSDWIEFEFCNVTEFEISLDFERCTYFSVALTSFETRCYQAKWFP